MLYTRPSSPIMTLVILIPSDIIYTSWDIIYEWLALTLSHKHDYYYLCHCCLSYFSLEAQGTEKKMPLVLPLWLLLKWPVKLLSLLTDHTSGHLRDFIKRVNFLTSPVCYAHKQAKHPMLRPQPSQCNLSSCRLTPMRWHPAAAERRPACAA